MDMNQATLDLMYRAFNASFRRGLEGAPKNWDKIAMTVGSTTGENVYAWLQASAAMREWIGDRQIKQIGLHDYSIKNRDFELTVRVQRNDIEDDQYGVYGPMFEELGRSAAVHPETLVFNLLAAGDSTACYDGQNFFDTDHPVGEQGSQEMVSNVQAGAGPAWYLLDTTRPVKPLIFQERKKASQLVRLDKETDENVFWRKEFVYGIDSRCNVGFGLWQLAYQSKAALDFANYKSARAAMLAFKRDNGEKLGIMPNLLVVPPELEENARKILFADDIDGTSNIWKGTAELIVTPYL